MPNWSDPADVRRWINEREDEDNQDKVRNWRGGQGIGPKTREEYEADLAAVRQDAGRAASWRAPTQQVMNRQELAQQGGRSEELLRRLYERAGYAEGARGEGRGAQEETTGRGATRATSQASTSDRLRDVEERPAVSGSDRVRDVGDPTIRQWRAPTPGYDYNLVTGAEQMQPGDTLPAHMRYRMGIESGQLPQPQSYNPPQSYMQAQDEQRMRQQAAALPEAQRGAGYDIGNAVTGALGPAWTYYESRRDQRADENQARIDEGKQNWYDPAMHTAGNLMDLAFLVPQKAVTSADTKPLIDAYRNLTYLAGGQMPPEQTPEQQAMRGMTPAQAYAPIGGAFNKLFNPFNPNNFARQGIPEENRSALGQWQYMLSQAGDYIWTEWQRNNAMNQALQDLPAEQRKEAELALLNATSGSQKAWDTFAAIQAKQNAGTLLETAKNLAAQGDTQTASQMYQAYREMEAKSYADLVDENQNIWAELVEGIFADPTSIVLDPLMDASMAAWRTSKATRRAADAAAGIITDERNIVQKALGLNAPQHTYMADALDAAVQDGIKMAGQLEQGITVPTAKNWIKWVFGRTEETKAHMEADALWKTATQLFRGVDNAQDARLLLQTWIENPAQLVQGVQGITSKALREVAGVADGKVRYGYLTVAGDEQLQALPILQHIKQDLLELPALKAEGGFNGLEFLTQMDEAIYNGVRQKYGLQKLEDLGEGAVRWSIRRLDEPGANGERWAIDYLNDKGGVVRTSDAMSLDAAKKYTAGLESALKAGTGSKVMGGLKMFGNVQRGFLSDMWLNLRPSHWIRNAAAATAATMADDLYTLRSVGGILDELGAKFVGAAPTLRLQETLTGAGKMAGQATQSATAEGEHWSRAIWSKNNPYAAVNEAASQVWSGMTHLFGTDIPFGEQAFYLRAFDKGFNRSFGKVWGDLVTQELAPKIQQLGIDPTLGKSIIDRMISAGVTGSKQDVAQAARKAVYGNFAPFDPRTLGVPDELFSADGWKLIQNGVEDWLASSPVPGANVDEITAYVLNVVADEKVRYGNILRSAPPQPGVYEWSKLDGLDEAAEVMDNLTEAATRAGMDPAQAKQQAQELAGRMVDGTQQAFDEVLQEVATANNPAALNVAFDLLTQLHGLKTNARRQVDELSRLAADASTPEMWAQKWQKTGEIYTQLTSDLEATIRGAADDIRTVVAGGQVDRKFDWWATVRRYFDYDQAKVMEARNTPLGGSKTPRELWDAAIDANRQYVDASMVQLYDAFRRYPSVDALDVLRQAQKQIDTEGARIAAWLAEKRDLALASKLKWEDYFNARNMAWYKGFDNMVVYNEAAKRAIVAQGMADQVPTQLRWADDFAGGEFFLIGPSDKKDGYWLARRLDDGTIHRFDTPGRDPRQASPTVPQEVLNDWYTVTDQASRIKPILAEIEAANPLPPKPEVPSGTLTLDSVAATPDAGSIPFDEDLAKRQATSAASDVDFGMSEPNLGDQVFPKPGDVVTDSASGKQITILKPTDNDIKYGRTGKDKYKARDADGKVRWYDGANLRKNPPEEPPAAAAATPEPAGPQPTAPAGGAAAPSGPVTLEGLPRTQPKAPNVIDAIGGPVGDMEVRAWVDGAGNVHMLYGDGARHQITQPDRTPWKRMRFSGVATAPNNRAVDAAGQPLTLYHGTTAANITELRPGANGKFGPGIYLSNKPEKATHYAEKSGKAGATVYPVQITARNPLVLDPQGNMQEVMQGIGDATLVDWAKAQGYDSIHAPFLDEWIVFEPEQVQFKLAGGEPTPQPGQLLTKPEGWTSPQRSEFLEPGETVTIKKTGESVTVSKRAESGGWYWVEKADGSKRRYKSESLERMEQAAPTPQPPMAATPEEGMAQAAGLDKPPAAWVTPEDQAKVDRLAAQGKKALTEEHGATLKEWGYSDVQIKRMSPEEMAHAITQTSSAPTPAYVETWQASKAGDQFVLADETRQAMRASWDHDVQAHYSNIPDLDSLAKKYASQQWSPTTGRKSDFDSGYVVSKNGKRYRRKGSQSMAGQERLVNMMSDPAAEKLFADVYGTTVGGQRIDSIADVERYVQQYVDGGVDLQDVQKLRASSQEFKGKGVTEIIAETYDELIADGWKPYEIKEMAARSRAYVLDQVAAARGLQPQWGDEFKGMATYESRVSRPSWMGEGDGWLTDDPKETLQNLYDLMRGNWGKRKQAEVGDVAVHMIQTLDDAAERIIAALPQLAQRAPNTLDAGQKRFLLQTIDGLLPQFDNAVSTARQTGEALANGAMLNYQDRRGFDSLLSLVFPYHYFWTRGGATWAKRLMTQPKTMNLVYEADRAIRNENQQTDLPMRLGGSIPGVANVMGGQVRAGNILNWLLPKPINDFVDPEAANNDLERWIMRFQQVTPGLMPATQFALNSYFDQVAPLPGGEKRVKENLRKYIPMYGAASDVTQAITGQPLPFGTDTYDPYRTRRALSMMAQEGQFDGATAQYAQQISMNIEQGTDRYAGIPQQAQQAADAAYQAAMQRAGAERALTSVTGLAAGTPLYYYPDAETELRQAQRDYGTAGYNPNTNPYGSAEQRRDVLEQNPGLPVYWSRNATPGKLTPAQSAQRSEMWEKLDSQVYNPMADAVTKAIIQNPAITEKEINQIKSVYYDRAEAIKAQYPDVPESERNVPSGANPSERAVYELENLLRVSGKPAWPGESAAPAELQRYYAEKAAWEEKRLNTIDARLNQFVQQAEADPTAEWQQELVRLVQGRYSSDLLRQYQEMKYATDAERAWGEMEALRQEQSAANWKSKGKGVAERMGPEAQALWNEYHATPKENRQALKDSNPAVREVIMAGYNPGEYDQAITLFGPDAWQTYYSPDRPQYPEGGDEATMQAYYDQLRQWNTANPRDAEMRMWLNGRATWGEKLSSRDQYYDFGEDWEEAQAIFGPDIFDVERAANTAPDFIAWRNANPDANMRLTGYKEWKKSAGLLPGGADWLEGVDLAVTPGAQPTPASMMPSANGMPRPLGSERRPVGAGDWQAGLGEVPPVPDIVASGGPGGLGGQAPQPSTIVDTLTPNTTGAPLVGGEVTAANAMTPGVIGMGTAAGTLPGSPYEWAMRNPSYAKYQASAAQWETRKQNVYQTFGQETGGLYEQYLSLPANSAERKAFKLEHPELRAVQLYTWQPEAYAQAEQLFGADGIMAWAKTPAYQDTPEAKAARAAYIDANPKAFTVGAWLYGRPGQDDEDTADDEQFRYNLGADYATAKEMFGANIWAVVEGYKRGWGKDEKRAYYNANPNLSPFFDWWYGNMPKTSTASTYTRSGSSYGGGYGGGGGGWSGGGGGGGGNWSPNRYPPRVDARWIDRDLEVGTQAIRRWRPDNNGIDLSWMRAGDRLKPEQLKAWRPKG